ncbi:molybdopterin-dependent oxidoreductase [Pseudonocardia sp. MCCB 268]|nr:molybdopterin-dependent oxidoreductase [Pseudonocardia cytotoxica]
MGVYVESPRPAANRSSARCRCTDGSATVSAGTSARSGRATAFAMLVSDTLGIPLDKISYVQSDLRPWCRAVAAPAARNPCSWAVAPSRGRTDDAGAGPPAGLAALEAAVD